MVADVEEQTTKRAADMAPATQAFIDMLKKKGWKVDLYCGHHTYKSLGMQKVRADFVWIPRYGKNKPAYPCDLWQHTETGRVAGVSGNVDLNTLIGSKPVSYFTGGSVAQSGKKVTLIDWMKCKGMDSSYKNREKLAAEYSTKYYEGRDKQNLELFAALKLGKSKEKVKVPDNKPSKDHAKAWEWACAKPRGYMDGTRPHEPVTREQLATILKRLEG